MEDPANTAERPAPPAVPGPSLRRARWLAALLDDFVRVPGTRWRFGLDPVLGLVPGLGDWMGWAVSVHLLVAAVQAGVPGATLVRMAGNIAVDALVGVVPLLGDLFDAAWKANVRNLALLERHVADPARARRASALLVVGVLGVTVLLLVAGAWAGISLLRWLIALV
jgi:hypothetical protein